MTEQFEAYETEYGTVVSEDYSPYENEGVRVIDTSGKSIGQKDIRERMCEKYGAGSWERQFHKTPVVNQYFRIGCVLFSLHGSPPKGYALYIHAGTGNPVIFLDPHGYVYERWENVRLRFDE